MGLLEFAATHCLGAKAPMRLTFLVGLSSLVALASCGDDSGELRAQVAALQTQVARPTDPPVPTATQTTVSEPTENPTLTSTATATPEPPPPTAVPGPPVVVAPPTAPPTPKCESPGFYGADLQNLDSLVKQAMALGLVLPGTGLVYRYAVPACVTECDRAWVDSAVLLMERLIAAREPANRYPVIPDNRCHG